MAKNNDPNTLNLRVTADTSDARKQFQDLQISVKKQMSSITKIMKSATDPSDLGFGIKDFTKIFGKTFDGKQAILEGFNREYTSLQSKLQKSVVLGDQKGIISTVNALNKLQESYKEVQRTLNRGMNAKLPQKSGLWQNIKNGTKALAENRKAANKGTSAWGRLFAAFKRIAIYRAIRGFLKALTSGATTGLNNLVQFSSEADETMSNLKNTLGQINNTMGVTLMSVLQALEPVLTSLGDSIVTLLDNFNLAMAKMNGKTTFIKAKKQTDDYADSLNDAGKSLADFDKFRVLDKSSQDDLFEEVKVADQAETKLSKFFERFFEVMQKVWAVLRDVVREIVESGALDALLDIFLNIAIVVGGIVKGVASFIGILAKTGALIPLLHAVAIAFIAIKAAALLAAAASAFAFVAAHPIIGTITIGSAFIALAGILGKYLSMTSAGSNITSGSGFAALADGGFTTANFIATNENGRREWIGRQAGTTAVVNDTEMTDLMYAAVRDGCYEGVVSALSDANMAEGTSSTSARVEVQGETLFTIVKDVARRQGLQFAKV